MEGGHEVLGARKIKKKERETLALGGLTRNTAQATLLWEATEAHFVLISRTINYYIRVALHGQVCDHVSGPQ